MKHYGHLENGKLVKMSFPIKYQGEDYFTLDPNILLAAGEKEIIYAKRKPNNPCRSRWIETKTQLIQVWEPTE